MEEIRDRQNRFSRAVDVAQRDVGMPLWFMILMAIFVVIITISIAGVFATNNKIKKNAGYKGSPSSTTTTV